MQALAIPANVFDDFVPYRGRAKSARHSSGHTAWRKRSPTRNRNATSSTRVWHADARQPATRRVRRRSPTRVRRERLPRLPCSHRTAHAEGDPHLQVLRAATKYLRHPTPVGKVTRRPPAGALPPTPPDRARERPRPDHLRRGSRGGTPGWHRRRDRGPTSGGSSTHVASAVPSAPVTTASLGYNGPTTLASSLRTQVTQKAATEGTPAPTPISCIHQGGTQFVCLAQYTSGLGAPLKKRRPQRGCPGRRCVTGCAIRWATSRRHDEPRSPVALVLARLAGTYPAAHCAAWAGSIGAGGRPGGVRDLSARGPSAPTRPARRARRHLPACPASARYLLGREQDPSQPGHVPEPTWRQP